MKITLFHKLFSALLAFAVFGLVLLLTPWPISVVDGDTVDRNWIRYRLVGYDTPEIRRSKCPEEKRAAHAAKQRLAALIAGAERVSLQHTSLKLDRYGRVLARLLINDEDVASIAIREGWGRAYDGRARSGWCSTEAGAAIDTDSLASKR